MKWYYLVFICSLQSLAINGMEPQKKQKKGVFVTNIDEQSAPAANKPSPPIRRKSKEIVVPRSANYALEKTLKRDAAVGLSAKQLAALAPHIEDRKCSPPKHDDRKEYRNSREIRQAIVGYKAPRLSGAIVQAQEQQIIALEEQLRKQMDLEEDDQRKQELATKLAAFDRAAITESVRVRLCSMQEERKEIELTEIEAKKLVEQAFAVHLAKIREDHLQQ